MQDDDTLTLTSKLPDRTWWLILVEWAYVCQNYCWRCTLTGELQGVACSKLAYFWWKAGLKADRHSYQSGTPKLNRTMLVCTVGACSHTAKHVTR